MIKATTDTFPLIHSSASYVAASQRSTRIGVALLIISTVSRMLLLMLCLLGASILVLGFISLRRLLTS
ncbi:hypothetical protein GBA52_028142 [Prunus armeniaca]|nr:hypothetical protein GBA52_028142 [Prunus armeniaca]